MKFARFARTFCWKIVTFGANLCELFPDLRIRHSEIGEETSELARMNRFDKNCQQNFWSQERPLRISQFWWVYNPACRILGKRISEFYGARPDLRSHVSPVASEMFCMGHPQSDGTNRI